VFSRELNRLIVQVLTSWQVIVVTLGLIIYFFIVFSAARLYRSARPRPPRERKPKKAKQTEEAEETGDTDDLGLGE
jgi:flagellar biosynthesis/type III secretory pathway M-ring protein FliF/YscJ